MGKRLLKIDKLILDKELYPRDEVNWRVAQGYKHAMKNGAMFPPISVGLFNKEFFVLDGWHRITALKHLKKDSVQAEVKAYKSKNDMYVEAVKLNSTHGKPFEFTEKLTIYGKLEAMNISSASIVGLLGISSKDLKAFTIDRSITDLAGNQVILKPSLLANKIGIQNAAQNGMDIRELQRQLIGASAEQILDNMLILLNTRAFDLTNEKVSAKLAEIKVRLDALISSPSASEVDVDLEGGDKE